MAENNFIVYPTDEKDFELKIKPELNEGKQLNVFCSFTYITPNYSILFTLEELKKFADSGNFKVIIVLWDMNTISNAYFTRLKSLRKVPDAETFINEKVKELRTIAESLGFEKEKLLIYRSSEIWKRLISYKEDNLFQQFYSILAQMQIKRYDIERDKISHLVQIPMDMFFCNYFHELYPEDVDREIDLGFFGQNKEQLYTITRELMVKNGLIENKNPIFILMKNVPYLIHNHSVPEWTMSLRDIKDILMGINTDKKDIFVLFRYLAGNAGCITVKGDKNLEYDYQEFYKEYKQVKEEDLLKILAENLYAYLQDRKKKYVEQSGLIEESILQISKKQDAKNIGAVLKSNIALEILVLADGSRNTTDMSKEIGKSVATISTYANRLKKMGLIRVLPDGNLKRNIKGVKINLELGI
ncbi:hypothetical protein COU60_03545 [Candidatus Pacearchaeota archaeon CG10_big_fil_rev_8_21_14_0_10_34_76]|nr:MAG: hypothetical protein COU60_03545 [Candidatus Pacearchaeota archaeon CG10_big_fil_rev_8_21_14_0_10_34_76]